MKKLILLLMAFTIQSISYSQFKIEAGATVTLLGTATLVLDDVDLVNEGILDCQVGSKVMFTGTSASNLTSNGDDIYNLEISKTGANVNLVDDLLLTNSLIFSGSANKLDVAANDLTLETAATVSGADATHYVKADGAGYMVKKYSAAGAFTYPVGDASNYSPLASNFTGTLGAAPTIKAKVTASAHPSLPGDATDYISRYWDVEAADITTYSNTVTGTYVAGDLTGAGANVKGASYGTSWSYAGAAAGANTATGILDGLDRDFTGSNFFGQVDLLALLQGPYSASVMTTSLTLPLTSPYLDAPLTVTSIPVGVTDWVKLEVRDATAVGTVVSKHSVFIKSDGSIVGVDGISLPLLKDSDASGYIALYHRNHLPIRTPSVLDFVNPVFHDFSAGLGMAYDNPAISTDAMTDLGGGAYGLYRANVSGDLLINLLDFIQTKNNTNPSQSGVYSPYDINMDGNLNLLDFIQARNSTNPSKSAHL